MKDLEFDQTPQIIGDEDWNLSNRRANAARASGILRHKPVVLEDFPVAELVHLAGEFGGQYALISKRDKLLEYYVHYEIHAHPVLGRCATQIKLWRSRTATVQGLASKVFDTYLLGGFDTIVSDSRQTGRGRSSGRCNSRVIARPSPSGCWCGMRSSCTTARCGWMTGSRRWTVGAGRLRSGRCGSLSRISGARWWVRRWNPAARWLWLRRNRPEFGLDLTV